MHLAHNGSRVLLIDCDVENPNSNILLNKSLQDADVQVQPITIFAPVFNEDLCVKCDVCRTACYRHAILQFPGNIPSVMDHMCSGCRTCQKVCPTSAISDSRRPIGNQYFLPAVHPNLDVLVGELNPTEAVSVLIVEQILEYGRTLQEQNNYDYVVIDTSPGAHCDVETALSSADVIACVTEPTPFGEHDLKRILSLITLLNKSAHVILNRANLTDYRKPIYDLTASPDIDLLGEIPLDPIVIEDYAKGTPFVLDERDFPAKSAFLTIYEKISAKFPPEVRA